MNTEISHLKLKNMKVEMKYSDWLLTTRGGIKPMVGDKIRTIAAIRGNQGLQNNVIKEVIEYDEQQYNSVYNFQIRYRQTSRVIENCFVEVDFPEIEWKEINTSYYALINKVRLSFDICEVDGIFQLDDSCNNIILKGTLEECKLKANELLFGV